jgi:hypothetical protein
MDAGWEELERMANAASAADVEIASEYPTPKTIERWKTLFGYSHLEAVKLIGDQRGDGAQLHPLHLVNFYANELHSDP